jgi:hypothetical protein
MGSRDEPFTEESQRLILLREALGFKKATAFAAHVNLDYKRYHNFERDNPIPRDAALTLVRAIPGLTTDWLYLGREEGLSFSLLSKLREAGALKAKTGAE